MVKDDLGMHSVTWREIEVDSRSGWNVIVEPSKHFGEGEGEV